MKTERLFFAMEAVAPWPAEFPEGRILLEADRHMTLAFIGDYPLTDLLGLLENFPAPPFRIALAGIFDRPVFLPERSPRTAGWRIHLLEEQSALVDFQKKLAEWLIENGVPLPGRQQKFLAHVTLARGSFAAAAWKKAFVRLPLYLKNIHLCESLGESRYRICWSYEILAPFEQKEHTADAAFLIRGKSFDQLLLHAACALAFDFPKLVRYFSFEKADGLEDAVLQLNQLIARADAEEGCPFKAVSFHSELIEKNGILEWEMIADV